MNLLLSKYGLEEVRHTYRGWSTEVDDLWHVAKYSKINIDREKYFEQPEDVKRYINIINPLRSLIYFPIYSFYSYRIQIYNTVKRGLYYLLTNPKHLFKVIKSKYFE